MKLIEIREVGEKGEGASRHLHIEKMKKMEENKEKRGNKKKKKKGAIGSTSIVILAKMKPLDNFH